jgi:hypothetical protein
MPTLGCPGCRKLPMLKVGRWPWARAGARSETDARQCWGPMM